MKTNTIKTMQYILSDVMEFCHDNIDVLYSHEIRVQHFSDGAIYIEATLVEKYSEPLEETKFAFSSSQDEWKLDQEFEKFRQYESDFYKRITNKI